VHYGRFAERSQFPWRFADEEGAFRGQNESAASSTRGVGRERGARPKDISFPARMSDLLVALRKTMPSARFWTSSGHAGSGLSDTHTTSVLDVLAFSIAYPTHRNTSGSILPMGKHNSTSLSPHSERLGRPSRSMRSHIGGAPIYRRHPRNSCKKLARLPHPGLPESAVPSRFRGKPEADQPRKAAQSTDRRDKLHAAGNFSKPTCARFRVVLREASSVRRALRPARTTPTRIPARY
jgi:hypothetical protein